MCVEQKDYKSLIFYIKKKKIALRKKFDKNGNGGLDNKRKPKKHGAVYELLEKVLNTDKFVNNRGKYSLKM